MHYSQPGPSGNCRPPTITRPFQLLESSLLGKYVFAHPTGRISREMNAKANRQQWKDHRFPSGALHERYIIYIGNNWPGLRGPLGGIVLNEPVGMWFEDVWPTQCQQRKNLSRLKKVHDGGASEGLLQQVINDTCQPLPSQLQHTWAVTLAHLSESLHLVSCCRTLVHQAAPFRYEFSMWFT